MNNLAKFIVGIFATLGIAWLAFVVGARSQYGDLSQPLRARGRWLLHRMLNFSLPLFLE